MKIMYVFAFLISLCGVSFAQSAVGKEPCTISNYGASFTIGIEPLKPGCIVVEAGLFIQDFLGVPAAIIYAPKVFKGRFDIGLDSYLVRTYESKHTGFDERLEITTRTKLLEKHGLMLMAGPRVNVRIKGDDPTLYGGIAGVEYTSGKDSFAYNTSALYGNKDAYSIINALNFSRTLGSRLSAYTGIQLANTRGSKGDIGTELGVVLDVPRSNSHIELGGQLTSLNTRPNPALQARWVIGF